MNTLLKALLLAVGIPRAVIPAETSPVIGAIASPVVPAKAGTQAETNAVPAVAEEESPPLLYEEPGIAFYAYDRSTTGIFRRSVEGLDYGALAATAREAVTRVERRLGLPRGGPLRILLVPSRGTEREGTSLLSLPRWAAGAAYGAGGDIVLVVGRAGSYPDTDLPGVLAHECAHVVLDRALAARVVVESSGRAMAGAGVPRWFAEGFAVLEAHPWGWKDALQLATTVVWERPPDLATLERSFPVSESEAREAYAVSLSVVAWMEREHGEDAPARIVRAVAAGASFDQAVRQVIGLDPAAMEKVWRGSAELRYRWIPLLTSSGTIWMLILGLLFIAGARRRARRLELEALWGERGEGEAEPPPVERPPDPVTGGDGRGNGHDRWLN